MRALLSIAAFLAIGLACAPASALPEDLTGEEEIPPGSDYLGVPRDLANTGIGIAPWVDHVTGPATLKVRNGTDTAITCEWLEDDYCPGLDLSGLDRLEPGEVWEISVSCALVDVGCVPADGDDRDLPFRTWAWFVEPLEEDF